jgi:hypothetical protein
LVDLDLGVCLSARIDVVKFQNDTPNLMTPQQRDMKNKQNPLEIRVICGAGFSGQPENPAG